MIAQQQLGSPQQLHVSDVFPSPAESYNGGQLGNKFGQGPSLEMVPDSLMDLYQRLRGASQPTFRLALVKKNKFTPAGREERIARSLAALNAAPPTDLPLEQWREIVEEIEDDED